MASVRDPVLAAAAAALAGLPSGPVGVACSGGADSMALADAVIAARRRRDVVVVHVDHGLRGDSAEVAAGVAAWASSRGVAVELCRVVVPRRGSLEAAARDARYRAFAEVIARRGLVALWLAHTADDQAETVLLRILRGTGVAGLAGMAAVRGPYHRPLLAVARAATVARVEARRLPVWPDPMNQDRRFARVRARQDLLPTLRAENPAVDAALARLAAQASAWRSVVDQAAAPLRTADGAALDCAALAVAPPAVAAHAISTLALERGLGLDAAHVAAVLALAVGPRRGTRLRQVPGGSARRVYDRLEFVSRDAPGPARGPRQVEVVGPAGPLSVRLWRPGDRMRPVRLGGRSRKLSDLFADHRVPRHERARAQVAETQDGTIGWAEHVGAAHGVEVTVRYLSEQDPG